MSSSLPSTTFWFTHPATSGTWLILSRKQEWLGTKLNKSLTVEAKFTGQTASAAGHVMQGLPSLSALPKQGWIHPAGHILPLNPFPTPGCSSLWTFPIRQTKLWHRLAVLWHHQKPCFLTQGTKKMPSLPHAFDCKVVTSSPNLRVLWMPTSNEYLDLSSFVKTVNKQLSPQKLRENTDLWIRSRMPKYKIYHKPHFGGGHIHFYD